jgi:L-aspartate oxidase
MKYDLVIVGAGIAGLYASLQMPRDKKVLIINKAEPWECNTFYAQGGVTTAKDDADVLTHISDTIAAGDGLCDEDAVKILSEHSREVVSDLIERGFEFDKDENGNLLYTQEAAHSVERILHAGGDVTGRHIHAFLFEKNPHHLLSNATVIDLIIEDGICCGVIISHEGEQKPIYAKHTLIASGGFGSLYEYHTNAYSISGDLHGICVEKGIELERMEMTQFHPTVYVTGNNAQKLLLTEALRGEGAHVEDENGYRFLFEYDQRGELASRDIVSRAIYDYNQKTSLKVYLSFKNFDEKYFIHRFPNIHKKLSLLGFNTPQQRVPISPAFHYSIGGIKTDLDAKVPSVKSLYAIGEVASTRVHGANRLASNSLLEGLVFAVRAARSILNDKNIECSKEIKIEKKNLFLESDKAKKDLLRRIMWDYVSIVRTEDGLRMAKARVDEMLSEPCGRLLKLRLLTAEAIISQAIKRDKSIGVHYITKG